MDSSTLDSDAAKKDFVSRFALQELLAFEEFPCCRFLKPTDRLRGVACRPLEKMSSMAMRRGGRGGGGGGSTALKRVRGGMVRNVRKSAMSERVVQGKATEMAALSKSRGRLAGVRRRRVAAEMKKKVVVVVAAAVPGGRSREAESGIYSACEEATTTATATAAATVTATRREDDTPREMTQRTSRNTSGGQRSKIGGALSAAAAAAASPMMLAVFDALHGGGIGGSAAFAAAAAAPAVTAASEVVEKKSDWLSPLSNSLESLLKLLDNGLEAVHVPYSYGFAIILLTVIVKLVTFPLTKTSVESTTAMQRIQPRVAELKARYPNDQEKLQLETARLYQSNGINPLAGCVPTLATIPVFIGLYRALTQAADDGLLTDSFFFIPSLAGPTSIAARQSGMGLQWLVPFVDGAPPIGWHDAGAYLILPVLIVASQFASMAVINAGNPAAQEQQNNPVLKVLPLMLGYFSLNVPSGLTLYWLTNNILSTAQQIYLKRTVSAAAPGDVATATAGGSEPATEIAEWKDSSSSAAQPSRKKPASNIPKPPPAVMSEFAGMEENAGANGKAGPTVATTTDAKPQSKAAKKRAQRRTRRR